MRVASGTPPRFSRSTTTAQPQIVRTIPADDLRVAHPIFTLREAAGYLGVPKSTVHQWASHAGRSALITVLPRRGAQATVPFIGFAEAYVLAAFRRAGVPLQRIRPAVDVLRREIGIAYALASQRMFTDGAEVLFDYAEQRDEKDLLDLVVVRTGQRQFSDLVRDYLRRISYGTDGWANELELPSYSEARVIVNPEVAFGMPIVTGAGARVEDLVDRFLAGDTVADIAADFDVAASQVEDVIRVATRTAA
ncbi:MAG TPA: DUF433 domain-containing protein [Solirubrobacter sp.]|nr:DUF433 domain-containing protein [Solirubrobacter sp.]